MSTFIIATENQVRNIFDSLGICPYLKTFRVFHLTLTDHPIIKKLLFIRLVTMLPSYGMESILANNEIRNHNALKSWDLISQAF